MENTNDLRTLDEHGWRMGFANLFREANGSWWGTRTWLVQIFIWLCLLNGMFAIFLWKAPADKAAEQITNIDQINTMEALQQNQTAGALTVFLTYSSLALPIAAIIFAQDAIIGERQSGTAAWVLSKPVSRPAFILSKLGAGAIGLLVTGVVIQGVVAYIQLSLSIGSPWPLPGFLGAMGLLILTIMVYLTLTFMLGSLFRSRGPVLGISLALAIGGPILASMMLPFLNEFTPWSFFMPISEDIPSGLAMALGQPLTSITPVVSSALLCLIFTVVTILRFQREEF